MNVKLQLYTILWIFSVLFRLDLLNQLYYTKDIVLLVELPDKINNFNLFTVVEAF